MRFTRHCATAPPLCAEILKQCVSGLWFEQPPAAAPEASNVAT